jgi:hypothetical protein
MVKKSYYVKKDEIEHEARKKHVEEKIKINLERIARFKGTNMPSFNQIIPPNTHQKYENSLRLRLLNKHIAAHINPRENRLPKIIFDFRYMKDLTSLIAVKSTLRQYNECFWVNMHARDTFKIEFYNYFQDTILHKNFTDFEQLMSNHFVDTYDHNYLQDYNKNDLIYLSGDSKQTMEYYDPTKTYIIGSCIDDGTSKYKYCSFTTAKKEGIKALKLPLDKYFK